MTDRVPPGWVVEPPLAARNAIGRAHRASDLLRADSPTSLREWVRLQVDVVARAHDFEGVRRVCEVGGRTGTVLVDTGAGRERTLPELRSLVARAHLEIDRVGPVSVSTILELVVS